MSATHSALTRPSSRAESSSIPVGAIVVASCLGMVSLQITVAPIGIEFARQYGATGLHVGLLGAIPAGMLFCQLLAGVVANRLTFRKPLWMTVSYVQRLVFLPVAWGPLIVPTIQAEFWLWSFIVLTAVNHGLLHFATPMWMSWMSDFLPQQGISRLWGVRQRWLQWSSAVALLFCAVLMRSAEADIRFPFAILMTVAAVAGVGDILIIRRVEEPRVPRSAGIGVFALVKEPFRHRDYRSFIAFNCFWHFAAMVGAPFISLYLMTHAGLSVSQVTFVWIFAWVGGAFSARSIGRVAERYGYRPLLVACTALKSSNMLALILLPADATYACLIMIPVFLLDSVLNAAFMIASHGFLMTKSPARNRTMFIATGSAVAGLVGGLTSIGAGVAVDILTSGEVGLGVSAACCWLFAASLVLRVCSVRFALRIREDCPSMRLRSRWRWLRLRVRRRLGSTPVVLASHRSIRESKVRADRRLCRP